VDGAGLIVNTPGCVYPPWPHVLSLLVGGYLPSLDVTVGAPGLVVSTVNPHHEVHSPTGAPEGSTARARQR
jgi:hypothetical protein